MVFSGPYIDSEAVYMTQQNLIIERFRAIERHADNGSPYWIARELMEALDYSEWRDFSKAIDRAKESCQMSGHFITNHFVDLPEMVTIGSGAKRERENFALSKYACYLIAMNGEPSKPEIATAQAYFVEQTYRQEVQDQLSEVERRAMLRDRLRDANRRLSGAAQDAGVRSKMFGIFQDAGYKGLYGGLGSKDIKRKKGIGEKDDLLDCIGPVELAANEFRATQTEDKLRSQRIKGEGGAIDTHFRVGLEVRKTIEKIGGTMPEQLPSAPSIKRLKSKKNQNQLSEPPAE
jgi:DNA-damage-inducible protein D